MAEESFESYRRLLFSIAYRMLGSAMDAEDIVQEAYLRYQAVPADRIRSPKAFLCTIVTRLSINRLSAAQVQREQYTGPWLPEPVLTDGSELPSSPAGLISQYESISMAFLVILESLTPAERAVFLLREVFDYEYGEIAEIVGKSEQASRKLYSRAKKHIAEQRPRFKSSPEEHERIVRIFLQAVQAGELEGLTRVLAEDVTVWTDGGGKVYAALRPVHGRENAARFILGTRRFAPEGFLSELSQVNGRPAVILRTAEGEAFLVITLEVDGGLIRDFHIVGNPDKLGHL